MGLTSTGHLNAFQKERLGWLNYGTSPPVQTITQSGTYHVDAMEPAGPAPKALKIQIARDSSGLRTFYYVEAQTAAGFDSSNGAAVIVHSGYEASGDSSYQIDVDPFTSAYDSALDAGQTFTDSTAGVTISTNSLDASGAWVTVTVSGPACAPASPTVTMSPSGMQSAVAGATVSYTMQVRNNDSGTCDSSTFGLSSLVPSGWTSSFGAANVTLAPGASTNTSFTVTSASNANGQYSVQAGAMRPTMSGSDTESINIISSFTVGLTTSSGKGGQYQISATVRANSAPAAGVTVRFTIQDPASGLRVLSATTNTSGVATVSFKPGRRDPTGTYSVQAVATLNSLSGSATGSFVVR